MLVYEKIIQEDEIKHILEIVEEDGISIGEVSSYNAERVIELLEVWCRRIDKIVKLDQEINAFSTWISDQALYYRGFTFEEYGTLFNSNIQPQEYCFYPVFGQLRKERGGIINEKQKALFNLRYEYNEEDYVRILLEETKVEPVLRFFFGKFGKLSAFMPLIKLKQHVHICAPTGSGKSELMRTIFFRLQSKYSKFTFILCDPHGDLALQCKRFILNAKSPERLIYIDPLFKMNKGYTVCYNVFQVKDKSVQNISYTVEQIIVAFEEVLSKEGGRVTEIMTNMLEKCIYFLLQRDNSTILDLIDLLNGEKGIFQEASQFNSFFDENFLKPSNKTREALVNRIERLINSPILKSVFGAPSTFDLEGAINSSKVILFNLSGLGEMGQVAFGKFLMASIKSIVRKRLKNTGVPVFVFVDEAHLLMSGSFEYALSQLRGFGLHLVLSHQYPSQLGSQAKAVKENTSVKIVAGEETEDWKDIIKIPKNERLEDYEFFLKVRNRPLTKFKAPDFLIKNPKKYTMSPDQEQEIDKMLLERYYKVIGEEKGIATRMIKDEVEERRIASPLPPFELNIPTND